jgi:acetoacetate decarboxylase
MPPSAASRTNFSSLALTLPEPLVEFEFMAVDESEGMEFV